MACNTSHVFLPDIIKNVPESKSRFVNIIEECGKQIYKDEVKEVGLIASEGTIESGIYSEYFSKYGIKINTPTVKQYGALRSLIEAVKQNHITEQAVEGFCRFVDGFEEERVVLGCTELPILCAKSMGDMSGLKKIYDPLQAAIECLTAEYYKNLN